MNIVFFSSIIKEIMYYLLIILVIFSLLPYLFSLNGDFVFDDTEAIVRNKDVFGECWTNTFSNDFWGANISSNLSHKSYRPLTTLTYRLNFFLSQETLVASHFKTTNLICHTICCIVVWLTFKIIFNDNIAKTEKKIWKNKAYLSALLFCVHPIHVESVSGIVGRADILAATLFFLALMMYHKAMFSKSQISQTFYILSTVIFSGVAMLCKENGITVLGVCIVYELTNEYRRPEVKQKASIGRMLFLSLSAICIVYGRWRLMGSSKPQFKEVDNPAAFADSTFIKVATFNYLYVLNALLLIWPQWLCYDWSMGCVPLLKGLDYRIAFVILIYLYGFLILRTLSQNRTSTNRHIIMAISLIVVPFLPAANIFYPVGFVIAERILYIPSAGFCLLIVIGLTKIIQRRKLRKIGLSIYFIVLMVFMLRSWQRSIQWRSEYELFTSALPVCPLNAKVHYNVAKVADAKHQVDWALEEYKEAIRLYPEYYQALNNLANLLKNLKQYSQAEFYLRKALSYKEDFPAAWMNLGIVLANTKQYDESHHAYHMALKYRQIYPDCYYNLGNLNLELNLTHDAMDNWFEAIKLNPKHNLAWTNLLALLDNTGQVKKAMEVIPKALAELSDSPSVNFAIANIYGKMERYEEAEKHFLKAIDLFDKNIQPLHYSNLGVLYHRWKKYKLAEKMYKNAFKIDPTFKSALQNLKSVQKYII